MKNYLTLILVLFLLSGCASEKRYGKTFYTLNAELPEGETRLDCLMTVRWTNHSSGEINAIPFVFDASVEDLLVNSVKVNGRRDKVEYTETGLIIRTPRLKPGKSVKIALDFKTPEIKYFRDNLLLFNEEIPYIPYCDSTGVFNVYMKEQADWDATIVIPDGFIVATTGMITGETASQGRRTYKSTIENVPGYGVVIMRDTLQMMESEAAGVRIKTFYFPEDSVWAPKLTAYAEDIIRFYTAEMGFYPQPVLSIIPGYDIPAGGWPVCPNVIGIHMGLERKSDPDTHAHWITAHEIGHQYWGFNHTMNTTDYPDWLGIALGIYTDRMYSRYAGLNVDYDDYFYEDYVEGVEAGVNTTIMRTVEELDAENIDWNNIIVHGKGWAVIRMLEQKIGEHPLREAIRNYLERNAGKNLLPEEFIQVCEEVSGTDLSEFFHTWLHTDDYLGYEIRNPFWNQASDGICGVLFGIDQTGTARADSIDIAIFPLKGKGEPEIRNYALFEDFMANFSVSFAPGKIQLDPHGKLPLINRQPAIMTRSIVINEVDDTYYNDTADPVFDNLDY